MRTQRICPITARHLWRMGLLSFLVFFLISPDPVAEAASDASSASPETIRFGIFPYKSPKALIEMYAPLAARIEQKLGKKIQLVSAPDANSFFEQVKSGGYDIVVPSITMYHKLRPSGYKVIAQGTPGFYGGVIVRQDSPVQSVADLKGKTIVALGEYGIVFVVVQPQLAAEGLNLATDAHMQFSGKIDTNVYGVVSRKYDAGILPLNVLDLPAFQSVRDQLRVVFRTPQIPQLPFVVRDGMDEKSLAVIRQELLSLSPAVPEDRTILDSMQVEKIVTATDADYQGIYDIIKDSDYFKKP